MKEILYISLMAPYKNVGHAGGKTLYHYLSNLSNNKDFHLTLVTFINENELDFFGKEEFSCDIHLVVKKRTKNIIKIIGSLPSKIIFFHRYANLNVKYRITQLLKKIIEIKSKGYKPDVIILEWTQISLLINDIKKIFPKAKYILSEHDVLFLNSYRIYKSEKKHLLKMYKYFKYINLHYREIKAISLCNYVITHNKKDKEILLFEGIEEYKIHVIVPCYYNLSKIKRNPQKTIIFWGAMNRKENEESVIWFIKNVIPFINKEIFFYIIGANPSEKLINMSNEQIIITGFVNNIEKYFSEALCSVVPLIRGAGIKVKVLEAMSAGIPVLTNEIGIEGISARNGIEYLECDTAQDYINAIELIEKDLILSKNIGNYAKELILREFNIDQSIIEYEELLYKI